MRKQIHTLKRSIYEIFFIFLGRCYNLRLQWFWYVIMMSISPLSYLFFLFFYNSSSPSAELNLYAFSGSIAASAVTAAMLSLGQTIGGLREGNAMEFYATLPISKLKFIIALSLEGILFSLPSSVIVFLIGASVIGVQSVTRLPLLLLAYFASAFSLAGIGALIGFSGKTPQSVSLTTQVIQPFLVLFAPVYMPIEKLPFVLQMTSRMLPTTYAARAIRYALGFGDLKGFLIDILILTAFSIAGIWGAFRKAKWRLTSSDAS
ncbi:MAG TPA: ABC transporter permease [Bacillota bacterium]|nr:ABC transporter permease [Bacillota bacterium]